MIQAILYILSIVTANVVTASIAPLHASLLVIPYGTFMIGLTFVLRDLVQMRMGRKRTYFVISTALLISAITSHILGDTLMIVTASAISFAFSETTDTEIFTRLRKSIPLRMVYSGIFGSIIDSCLFAVVGLIPAGFITWEQLPMAIAGQVIVKVMMQFLVVGTIGKSVILKHETINA